MEKISHRITLDVHKGGIQKVLHGMFTGDVLSRKIVISLVAGSAVCNMDESTTAVMYVTKPSGVTNYGACTVEGNLVTYDILPADIDEPGITQMQLKVVSGDMVLYAPMFSVEAQKNSSSDTPAETSPQFSALEQALAQVEEVYNKRIVSVEVEEDYTFVITYADGETYTSDAFKALMEEIEKAEHERAVAEAARDVAEENRELAENVRVAEHSSMKQDIQSAIDANTALYNKVEELADEGLITESRVIEIIEEQGGGGGGGTVVLPDNVLVASDVTAADVEAPKINADLFGSLPPSDYAKTSDVEGIKIGTTQVGNAKTLDGHEAEYFATAVDLSNYFPKSGGIVEAESASVAVKSTKTGKQFSFVSDNIGRMGLYDNYNGKWVLQVNTDNTVRFFGVCDGNVPLDGSKPMTTSMFKWMNGYSALTGSSVHSALVSYPDTSDTNNCSALVVFNQNAGMTEKVIYQVKQNGVDTNYVILHTGNKPTGTYTGNGDATERKVDTKGINHAILIRTNGSFSIVTPQGAIIASSSGVTYVDGSVANFANGVLTLKTDTASLNASGVSYSYQVL